MTSTLHQDRVPKLESTPETKSETRSGDDTIQPRQEQPRQRQPGATPSGLTAENPGTTGAGKVDVRSKTPENAAGRMNPSSPEDANITPGSGAVK